MKGAMSLPVAILVFLIVGIIVILISYLILGPLIGTASGQSVSASLTGCCAQFVLGGYCEKDDQGNFVSFTDIDCSVDKSLNPTGKMRISELASKAAYPAGAEGVQSACCK